MARTCEPFLGPPFSVLRRDGFHCGVKGCCEGKQVEHRRWHGIGSGSIVYTVRPSSQRTVMLTVRTGEYPPSVTWVGDDDRAPSGIDLSWFQRSGPGEEEHVSTCSGLDAEEFYARLQREHEVALVPDEAVLDALLAEAGTNWPAELLASSPTQVRTPVSARGGRLSATLLRLAPLLLPLGAMCSCAPTPASPDAPPAMVRASWKPLEPPRAGLRCWYSYDLGHGVAYCEPDPTATFGASP
jgi:hypothetical protein